MLAGTDRPCRLVLGPPIGAALYTSFGFRAPFIFAIAFCMLDAVGRLIIIERKDALKYGHDPAFIDVPSPPDSEEGSPTEGNEQTRGENTEPRTADAIQSPTRISSLQVLIKLGRSPRAMIAIVLSVLFGLVNNLLFA